MALLQGQGVTRPTFWQIGPVGKAAFYYLAAVTILVFLVGVVQRVTRYRQARPDPVDRLDDFGERVLGSARLALSNAKQFDGDLAAGLMHTAIVWGFLTLLVATTILGIDIDLYRPLTGDSFFVGDFYLSYSFVVDAMGLFFVVGVGVAAYRRYVAREERLQGKHSGREDLLFLGALLALGVGGYLTEAVRILGQGVPAHETVSFVGYALALVGAAAGVSPDLATAVYPVVWWSHALLAFWFIAWIPFAKPFHMLSSYANVLASDDDAGRRLPGVPLDPEADTELDDVDDFTWKQLLDQDACTKCGRCSAVCPAKDAGRPLDPRDVILDLKSYREARDAGAEATPIVTDGGTSVIDAQTMRSCVSCMACMDACPVDIEHLTHFTDMNRQLVEDGDVDGNVQDVFQNVMQHGNTFGDSARARPDWTEDLDFEVPDAREGPVEFLWYVGDYPSYDERNRAVARSLARIFEHAGVDYGILYEDEVYDGNDVRRLGEELLYVEQAAQLVGALEDCEFEELVCTDPHSYNTITNEYTEVDFAEFADDPMLEAPIDGYWNADGEVTVSHYTQVVERLHRENRLDLGTVDRPVTYHDPCHLGRYNDEYDAPRELVRATGADLVEMPRNREDSFCCGGGGGGLWLDHEEEYKPSEERLREAVEDCEAAPEQFVVACPMCVTMFEDGRKTGGFEEDLEIVDLTELLAEALER